MTEELLEKLNENRRLKKRLEECLDFLTNKGIDRIEFHTHIGDCIDNEKFSLYFKQMETLFDIVKCGICKEIKRLDNEFSIK